MFYAMYKGSKILVETNKKQVEEAATTAINSVNEATKEVVTAIVNSSRDAAYNDNEGYLKSYMKGIANSLFGQNIAQIMWEETVSLEVFVEQMKLNGFDMKPMRVSYSPTQQVHGIYSLYNGENSIYMYASIRGESTKDLITQFEGLSLGLHPNPKQLLKFKEYKEGDHIPVMSELTFIYNSQEDVKFEYINSALLESSITFKEEPFKPREVFYRIVHTPMGYTTKVEPIMKMLDVKEHLDILYPNTKVINQATKEWVEVYTSKLFNALLANWQVEMNTTNNMRTHLAIGRAAGTGKTYLATAMAKELSKLPNVKAFFLESSNLEELTKFSFVAAADRLFNAETTNFVIIDEAEKLLKEHPDLIKNLTSGQLADRYNLMFIICYNAKEDDEFDSPLFREGRFLRVELNPFTKIDDVKKAISLLTELYDKESNSKLELDVQNTNKVVDFIRQGKTIVLSSLFGLMKSQPLASIFNTDTTEILKEEKPMTRTVVQTNKNNHNKRRKR